VGISTGFDYVVRRSSRAKNIRITVGENGVVVALPERVAERHAHEFVAERAAWIERALSRLRRHEQTVLARSLADGSTIPYLGSELTLRLAPGAGRVHARLDEQWVRVRTTDTSREAVAPLLERWYRRQAREEIARRLDPVVARNGTVYSKLAIRDQRSRWGSCSSSGTLSFNWRLLLAPEQVLDYVIEHEAAHIEVRDHSKRFWALMDARVPDWRIWRDWLRDHGGTLRLA
jgi:predicted metal-dependent hydrolase